MTNIYNINSDVPTDGTRCLVWVRGQWEILTYNTHYKCWDDAEGDDYLADLEQYPIWAFLPGNPNEKHE